MRDTVLIAIETSIQPPIQAFAECVTICLSWKNSDIFLPFCEFLHHISFLISFPFMLVLIDQEKALFYAQRSSLTFWVNCDLFAQFSLCLCLVDFYLVKSEWVLSFWYKYDLSLSGQIRWRGILCVSLSPQLLLFAQLSPASFTSHDIISHRRRLSRIDHMTLTRLLLP